MSLDFLRLPMIQRGTFNRPGDRLAERLAQGCPTGFADGRQRRLRPSTHTALTQLCYQQTVHQQDEVHMPGLALAAPQLTVAEPQMLFAVSMQGFRACPASAITCQAAGHFPVRLIGDENLDRLFAVPMIPQDDDPHGVIDLRQPDRLGKVPLRALPNPQLLARCERNLRRHFFGFHLHAAEPDTAIKLQIADVTALMPVDMIEHWCIGEIDVKGEGSRNLSFDDPVDQFAAQNRVVLESRQSEFWVCPT